MSIAFRNNVNVTGAGPATIIFSHGYGCDQSMWRHIAPVYSTRFKVVLFDLVGSGGSNLSAYDRNRYGTLDGYADDLLEIVEEFAEGPVFFIGHSVSATIGMIAGTRKPGLFAGHVMVSPSPCYINDGDYVGGFNEEDIAGLLEMMHMNFFQWSAKVAPMIAGAAGGRSTQNELIGSFCRNDPDIAKHFAEVVFRGDHRALVPQLADPVLILQCSDDLIAPREVGEYMHRQLPDSEMKIIHNDGHCPHMTAPGVACGLIEGFIDQRLGQTAKTTGR